MTLHELNQAIEAKTLELALAQEAGKPDPELMVLYKELKELKYQKIQAELKPQEQGQ